MEASSGIEAGKFAVGTGASSGIGSSWRFTDVGTSEKDEAAQVAPGL